MKNFIRTNKIVLMYHSISSAQEPGVVGSFPISFHRFMYQIESLIALGYKSGKLSELCAPLKDHEKLFFITGDDGTVDWSRNVLQWCEDNKIYTHTAIITGVWENPPVYPLTHIIQILLSTRSSNDLKLLANKFLPYLSQDQLSYIRDSYSYEQVFERQIIKGACNLIFLQDDVLELIGDLTDEETLLLYQRFETSEFYKRYKFTEVGVHTTSHKALDLDLELYLNREIDASKSMLVENGLDDSGFFTLPLRPKHGATENSLIEPLKLRGYQGILTSYSGFWDSKSFVIPRVDACEMEKVLELPVYNDAT